MNPLPKGSREGVDPNAGGYAPYQYLGVPGKANDSWMTRSPRTLKGGKGGSTMTFEEIAILLSLIGGAIYVTFQITWTVSHSDDKDKKK